MFVFAKLITAYHTYSIGFNYETIPCKIFLSISQFLLLSGDNLRNSGRRGDSTRYQRDRRVYSHHHPRLAAKVQEDPREDSQGRHHHIHGGPAQEHRHERLQGGHQDRGLQRSCENGIGI